MEVHLQFDPVGETWPQVAEEELDFWVVEEAVLSADVGFSGPDSVRWWHL